MNLTKGNLVLFAIAAALAVPTALQLRADVDPFVDIGTVPLLFDGFHADNVGSVVLQQPKGAVAPTEAPAEGPAVPRVEYDTLVLQRGEKGWRLGGLAGQVPPPLLGAPVQEQLLESDVFTHFASIRREREALVQPAATSDQLQSYGLDEEHAFVVKALDRSGTRVLASLLVGNDASGGQGGTDAVRGVFVRAADSDDVVLYEWERPWLRSVDAARWIDRQLWRIAPEKVRRVSIQNVSTRGRPFVWTRQPGKSMWQCEAPPFEVGAVRQMEVENLVQRLRDVQAWSFEKPLARAGDMATLGLYPPQLRIELSIDEGGSGRDVVLEVGNQVEGRKEAWFTCNESQFLMTWPSGTVATFDVDVPTRLFDPLPPK